MLNKGYGIMPNNVLYSKDLTDKQKLLYVMISSLCAEKGHCWASNGYLSRMLGCSETRVSKQISDLNKKGYLKVSVNVEKGNQRTIELQDNTIEPQNNTSGTTVQYPSGTTVQHNNTITNITSKEIKKDFSVFRELYPLKKKKSDSYNKFERYIKSGVKPEDIIQGLRDYIKEHELKVRSGEFAPSYQHPSTRLNGKCREDEYDTNERNKPDKKGRIYYK